MFLRGKTNKMATVPIEIDTLREIRSLLEQLAHCDKTLPLSRTVKTFAAHALAREQTLALRTKIDNLLSNAPDNNQPK